jgi:EmrB/QacA subfamily drug resistance transporter
MTLPSYSQPQPCDKARLESFRDVYPCAERDKPWILATAILGSSIAFIEGSVVSLALPNLQSDLGVDAVDVQWIVNVYLLVLGAFTLIGGSLGDRFGLRGIFVLGNAVFAAGALGCAAASSFSVLIASRLVQSAGSALLIPTSLALIGSHFDKAERGRAIGTWAGASALTTALGPVLGGWLVDRWNWPAVFLLVAPLALLTIAFALWRVPPSPARHRGPLDFLGALLLAAALGSMIYAIVSSGSAPLRAVIVLVAAGLGGAFLKRESHFDTPLLPLRLFGSGSFSGANAITLLLYGALSGALYFLPFNLIQVQGYSATEAGAAFLPMTMLLGVGSVLAGDALGKLDARTLLTVGPLVAGAGFAALAVPGVDASYVGGFLPGIVMLGLGLTLSVSPLTTAVLDSVDDEETGVASGVNNTVSRLAGVIAVGALTAAAIAWFSGDLEARLRDAELPPAVVENVVAGASRLAELAPPPQIEASAGSIIRNAISRAYVGTFRWIVIVCAGLSVISSIVAWFSLAGRSR